MMHFNPNLVRFKLVFVDKGISGTVHFNPNLVRFKRGWYVIFTQHEVVNFNPNLVRFKLGNFQTLTCFPV